jgi:hypothetical protein
VEAAPAVTWKASTRAAVDQSGGGDGRGGGGLIPMDGGGPVAPSVGRWSMGRDCIRRRWVVGRSERGGTATCVDLGDTEGKERRGRARDSLWERERWG